MCTKEEDTFSEGVLTSAMAQVNSAGLQVETKRTPVNQQVFLDKDTCWRGPVLHHMVTALLGDLSLISCQHWVKGPQELDRHFIIPGGKH